MAEPSLRWLGTAVREIARGLIRPGVRRGERVSILASTRAEWTLADLGTVWAGAIVAPIYDSNSPEECRYILEHAGSHAVFCEGAQQLAKVAQVAWVHRRHVAHHQIQARSLAPVVAIHQVRVMKPQSQARFTTKVCRPLPIALESSRCNLDRDPPAIRWSCAGHTSLLDPLPSGCSSRYRGLPASM